MAASIFRKHFEQTFHGISRNSRTSRKIRVGLSKGRTSNVISLSRIAICFSFPQTFRWHTVAGKISALWKQFVD